MDNNDKLLEKMIQLKSAYENVSTSHWFVAELFEWQWWVSIVLLFLPLLIWWKLLDKKRIFEIIAYGLLTNIMASFIDVAGSEYTLWEYPIRIHPAIPRLLPFDFIIVPTTYMLIYQYFPKWKNYIIVLTISALIGSFVIEPIFVWMNLYKLITWKYIYSFPCYIAIGAACKGINSWFLNKVNNAVLKN